MSAVPSQPPEENGEWLAGCRGFRVESASGRLGFVAEIRHDPESGRPEALVVRAGRLGMHRLVIPVDEIAGVVPGKGIIVLQQPWSLAETSA